MTDATRASNTRRLACATFDPAPSPLGRAFLRAAAMHRWLHSAPCRDEEDERIERRLARYRAELVSLAREILARPVVSLADMVDRLILMAHEADPVWIDQGNFEPILDGALAAAGLLPADCRLNRGVV